MWETMWKTFPGLFAGGCILVLWGGGRHSFYWMEMVKKRKEERTYLTPHPPSRVRHKSGRGEC